MKRMLVAALVSLSLAGLGAQSNYPLKGHPQGGDRRGTYIDAKGRPADKTIPLFKDPKIYLNNMTLLSHIEEGGTTQMMTVGDKRYLVGARVIDVTDPKHPVVVKDNNPRGQVGYNKDLKKWILMSSSGFGVASQQWLTSGGKVPNPEFAPNPPRFFGVTFYDVTDPLKPIELGKFEVGGRGVHGDGNYYDGGRYAYISSGVKGTRGQHPYHRDALILQIIDVADPMHPKEAGRYWVPGQMLGEDKEFATWPNHGPEFSSDVYNPDQDYYFEEFHGPCYVPKRLEEGGNRGYCSWGSLGFIVLDLSDVAHPKQVGRLNMNPPFNEGVGVHTVIPMPERQLAFINSEPLRQDCEGGAFPPFVIDLRAETNPVSIGSFPLPKAPADAPYTDFCFRAYRFGTHWSQEFKAPGEARIDLMGYTWFAGGFRLYDVSNPFQPREVAWMVPKQGEGRGTEEALIEWDRNLVYVFADTGTYILSTPVLGDPVLGPLKPKRWSPAGVNATAP